MKLSHLKLYRQGKAPLFILKTDLIIYLQKYILRIAPSLQHEMTGTRTLPMACGTQEELNKSIFAWMAVWLSQQGVAPRGSLSKPDPLPKLTFPTPTACSLRQWWEASDPSPSPLISSQPCYLSPIIHCTLLQQCLNRDPYPFISVPTWAGYLPGREVGRWHNLSLILLKNGAHHSSCDGSAPTQASRPPTSCYFPSMPCASGKITFNS